MTIFKNIFERDFDKLLLENFERVIDYNVRLIVLDENNHDLYLMIRHIFSELELLSKNKSRQLPEHYYEDHRYICGEAICSAIRQQRTCITGLMTDVLNDERLVYPEINYIVSRTAILSLTNILSSAHQIQLIDGVNLSRKEDLCCLREQEKITKEHLKALVSSIHFTQSPTVARPIRMNRATSFAASEECSTLDTSAEGVGAVNMARPA